MRRLGRVLGRIALGGLALLALALLALVLATQVPALRARLAEWALTFIPEDLGLAVEIGSVHRLDPWGLDMRDVRVSMPAHGLDGRVGRLRVELSPLSLLEREVRLEALRLGEVRLRYQPPVAREAEPEAAPAPEDAEAAPWAVIVDDAILEDVRVDAPLAGRRWWATVSRCEGRGGNEEAVQGELTRCRFAAGDATGTWLSVQSLRGVYHAEIGGTVELEGALAQAPLSVRALLPPLAVALETYPVDALELSLGGVDRQTLAQLGVEDGAELRTPVHLGLAVERDGRRLDLALEARAREGRVSLRGSVTPRELQASVYVAVGSLARVSGVLPEQGVRGRLRASYQYARQPQRMRASWRNVSVDGEPVPDGSARVSLRLPRVTLEQLELRAGATSLDGVGYYDMETGAVALSAQVHELSLALLTPWVGAEVKGSLSAELSAARTAAGWLDARAKLSLHGVRVGETVSVQAASVEVGAGGTLEAIQAHARWSLMDTRADEWVLDHVVGEAALQDERVNAQLWARGEALLLGANVWGALHDDGGVRVSGLAAGRVMENPFQLTVRELGYRGGDLELAQLVLRSGAARAELRGQLGRGGALRAALSLRSWPLEMFAELASDPALQGELSLDARVSGTLAQPVLTADLTLLDTSFAQQAPFDALARVSLDGRARAAELRVGGYGRDGLDARLRVKLAWPKAKRGLVRALARARADVSLSASTPVERVYEPYLAQRLPPARLSVALQAEGTLETPRAALYLAVETDDTSPEYAHGEFQLTKEVARVALEVHDARAPLLSADAQVGLPEGALRRWLEGGTGFRPTELRARFALSERRLDELAGLFGALARRYGFALPVRVGAQLGVRHADDTWDGRVEARALAYSDALDPDCRPGSRAQLTLHGQLSGQRLEGAFSGTAARGGNFFLNFSVSELFALASGDFASVRARVDGRGVHLPLTELPGLCQLQGGYADFGVAGRLSPGRAPNTRVALKLVGVPGPRGEVLHAEARAGSDATAAWLDTRLESDDRKTGSVRAVVPMRYRGLTPGLVLNEPVFVRVKLDEFRLAPALQFTRAVSRVAGSISTDLALEGTLRDPKPQGFVEFHNVALTIAAIAQPLRRISGRIALDGDTLTLQDLSVRDRGGKLQVGGKAKLATLTSGKAELSVRADEFPLRRQGTVVAELTLDANLEAELDAQARLLIEALIEDGNLWLTGGLGRNVQSLDDHPEVRFVDERAQEEEEVAGQEISLEFLHLRSERDLWLMHKDFSVQVGVDLTLKTEEGQPELVGQASITRGNLKLLGKSFNIQRGAVYFTGVYPPEPELDLSASYDPAGGGGSLVVNVTGPASAPVLSFSGAADTPEEALAILSGMAPSQASASAQADARNFALGLTAGLLSVTARRELGDWVPMLAIETGQRGVSQARAGFDASDLIPEFMRGFTRGAYVEGVVGQTREVGGNVGLGVRLELTLPRSVVTSVGYGPGPNWNADVLWVP